MSLTSLAPRISFTGKVHNFQHLSLNKKKKKKNLVPQVSMFDHGPIKASANNCFLACPLGSRFLSESSNLNVALRPLKTPVQNQLKVEIQAS